MFEILQKKNELLTLTILPDTAPVHENSLKHMAMSGEFSDIAPAKTAGKLSLDMVKMIIKSLVLKFEKSYDPQCVEKALRGLLMPVHIAGTSARVLHLLLRAASSSGWSRSAATTSAPTTPRRQPS